MTHIPEAVAWTLIHFCWQAAAVAAVYRLVALALAHRSAQTRYIAAVASLLLMVCFAAGTFAWELRADSAPITMGTGTSDVAAPIFAAFPQTTAPGIISAQTEQGTRISLPALLPWIDGIWLLGVLALTIRSFGGWWHLRRLQLMSSTEAPAAVRVAFTRISEALGLHRLVTLRLSPVIDGPLTVGALRSIVLLPLSAITSLGPDELEVVLAHELAHVRRADFFWNVLQTIAETLFFFHPAVWWISARIRHERELCCDDLALTVCPNPIAYAHALYRLEEKRSRHSRLAMALDGHASRATLLLRIARILGEPMNHIPSHRFRPFSLVATCAGLVVLLIPAPHVLAKFAPAPLSTPPAVASDRVTAPQIRPNVNTVVHAIANTTTQAIATAKPSPYPRGHDAAAEQAPAPQTEAQSDTKTEVSSKPHADYIDSMKAAGYDVDLDKYIAMKIQGITSEYARAMANAGFGKPSANELISCKIQGVTPEYIAQLKQQGFEIKSFQDAVSFRIFNVTPEFVSGMKAAGFDNLTSKQIISIRVQGVTPEFARSLKQKFPNVTVENLIQARIFHIDDEFMAQVKKHGFDNLPFNKLVQLRISGLFDDESVNP